MCDASQEALFVGILAHASSYLSLCTPKLFLLLQNLDRIGNCYFCMFVTYAAILLLQSC